MSGCGIVAQSWPRARARAFIRAAPVGRVRFPAVCQRQFPTSKRTLAGSLGLRSADVRDRDVTKPLAGRSLVQAHRWVLLDGATIPVAGGIKLAEALVAFRYPASEIAAVERGVPICHPEIDAQGISKAALIFEIGCGDFELVEVVCHDGTIAGVRPPSTLRRLSALDLIADISPLVKVCFWAAVELPIGIEVADSWIENASRDEAWPLFR